MAAPPLLQGSPIFRSVLSRSAKNTKCRHQKKHTEQAVRNHELVDELLEPDEDDLDGGAPDEDKPTKPPERLDCGQHERHTAEYFAGSGSVVPKASHSVKSRPGRRQQLPM